MPEALSPLSGSPSRPLAGRLTPGTRVEDLPATYEGPVFAITVDKTLTDPADAACHRGNSGGLVAGSQALLSQVAAMGIPIAYVATQASSALQNYPQGSTYDSMAALRAALPKAHLFQMDNDGSPSQFAQGPGRLYLLNVQPDQKNVPAGWNGVLTDNFTQRFQDLVVSDLSGDMRGLPCSRPTWEPTPPAPSLNFLQQKAHALTPAWQWLHGVPGEKLKLVAERVFGAREAHDRVQQGDLSSASLGDLQSLAQSLLHPGLSFLGRDTLSQDFMNVITARGSEAGYVDSILTMVPKGRQADQVLTGPAREAFLKLMEANRAVPGDWQGFDTYLDQATGTVAHAGSKVEPLINGEKAFPAMLDAIDHAQSSVNWTTYAFQSDETGWEVARHLAAAADKGRDVKLIYDPIGSHDSNGAPTDPKIFDFLREHGVQVVAQKTQPMHVTHRKILVVDGSTGFIGGMNVGNEYRDTWHDVHSKVTGAAVADMQRLFVEQWRRNGQTFTNEEMAKLFPALANVAGDGTARIIGHVGMQDQNMKLAYLRAIDTAEHTINIADPYFTDTDVAEHLADAARRGVRVRLVFPKVNDDVRCGEIARTMYQKMIDAGVEIYEYSGRPMAHNKVASFDGKVSTIGSSNLDTRSMEYNDEANVWSTDPAVAQDLDENLFGADLAQSTRIPSWHPTMLSERIAPAFRRLQ